jgi:protein-L-isoaspartate(D-aspartate) O-methyltransferase
LVVSVVVISALTVTRKPVESALGLATLLLGWLAWYLARGKRWFSAYVEDMRKPALLMRVWLGLGALIAAEMALPRLALAAEDTLALARQRMVAEQLSGPGRNITNALVLAAMGKVPRHEFVPERLRSLAYEDCPLPIGHDQTISQPYIVAFMTEQLEPKPTDRVLEIGTGSGYQAAVLAELVAKVYTVEIIEDLAGRAAVDLKRLGYTNVSVRAGDGYKGWPEAAPFDAIIVTCAPEKVPPPLVEQLKDGGRMIIPVGPTWDQELVLLRKQGDRLERQAVLPVRFVPMTGQSQGAEVPKPKAGAR